MVVSVIPRYEFRIFGNDLAKYESKIKKLSSKEMTRQMDSVYLLTPWKRKNNVKIREGVMDIKVLEQDHLDLQQWNPFLVGEFPLDLKQFINEVVTVDPDLAIAYVWKTRHAYTVANCITEIAEIKVNGAAIKTICIESENPKNVIEAKKLLTIDGKVENVSYPLALKRIMGLTALPESWNSIEF
ncbi:MAG: hypothetical protein B6I19_11405 [Bacteroidetes bacterium 4572_114]|nr:MAG: hypothetical protein B6I19_11405 [Bacteroidetes bacterium 4572_114]